MSSTSPPPPGPHPSAEAWPVRGSEPAPGAPGPPPPADAGDLAPSSRDPEALVRRFHEVFGVPIAADGPSVDRDRVHLRLALVAEEFAELVGAVYGPAAQAGITQAFDAAVTVDAGTRDVVGAADALADLVYVLYGMALECGIPLPAVLAQVQASNMSKLGRDGRPIHRSDGKVLKGPGYTPPDIPRALGLDPTPPVTPPPTPGSRGQH